MSKDITASGIQSHLYSSFLERRTPDIVLRIRGRWRANYHLHRVVLIQSEFFDTLFNSGFKEAADLREIDIAFDDTNITRPAFELCLSRLYGGGPPLHLPASLVPSTSEPLSPSSVSGILPEAVPIGSHFATPRFLLSLLATSIYLSIPSIASQALSLIFKTIGPYTVISYLNFALGKSIDAGVTLWKDAETVVGLESIAEILDDDSVPDQESGTASCPSSIQESESLSIFETAEESDSSDDEESESSDNFHHYGPISDKIGEACACWLVRWASDMYEREKLGWTRPPSLPHACDEEGKYVVESLAARWPVIWGRAGLDASWVCSLISADTLFVKNERARFEFARDVVEMRRRGGILKSEEKHYKTLFEEGIYYSNMPVEDIISISKSISPSTSRPYVCMTVLQAALWNQSLFRHQVCFRPPGSPGYTAAPRDKELGVSLSTQELAGRKDVLDPNCKYYYPVLGNASLRIGEKVQESQGNPDGNIVSMEDLFNKSHSPTPSTSSLLNGKAGPGHKPSGSEVKICTSEDATFGVKPDRYTIEECIAADPTGQRRWTTFPPQRFAVEFWDVNALQEKSRLHSQTIWYAGSLYNVYVQIVPKKNGQPQVGIYLHRQSSIEPIPHPSSPCPPPLGRVMFEDISLTRTRSSTTTGHHLRSSVMLPPSPPTPHRTLHPSRSLNVMNDGHAHAQNRTLMHSSSLSPLSSSPGRDSYLSSSPPSSSSCTAPYTSSAGAPVQPYRDPRSCVTAYFSVSCSNATGTSQMRFTSAPDSFSVSQSWGWKTSVLRSDEYMEIKDESSAGAEAGPRSRMKSLRATVIVGLI